MLRGKIGKLARKSSLRLKPNGSGRRQAIIESVMNDYKTRDDSPRTAKYRSFRGLFANR